MKGAGIFLLMAVLVGCGSNSTTMPNDGSTASGTGGGGGADSGAGGGNGNTGTTAISNCDVNNAGSHTCYEYSVGYTGSVPAGCAVLHGTVAMAPCDHAGSSGGCKQPAGGTSTQTTYYYPPIMPADVMVQCRNDANATYVAP